MRRQNPREKIKERVSHLIYNDESQDRAVNTARIVKGLKKLGERKKDRKWDSRVLC